MRSGSSRIKVQVAIMVVVESVPSVVVRFRLFHSPDGQTGQGQTEEVSGKETLTTVEGSLSVSRTFLRFYNTIYLSSL